MNMMQPSTALKPKTGIWSTEEHERFLDAMDDFISWDHVARRVGTRSRLQCRTHNQKIEKRVMRARQGGVRAMPRVEHRLPTTPAMQTNVPRARDLLKMKMVVSPAAMKQPISPPGVDNLMMLLTLHDGGELIDSKGVNESFSPVSTKSPISPPSVDDIAMTAWPLIDPHRPIGTEVAGFSSAEDLDLLLQDDVNDGLYGAFPDDPMVNLFGDANNDDHNDPTRVA